MTIYIESFLLQNILINFCLLRLVYLTTKTNTKFFKMILSAIFGAIFSVFAAIFLKNVIVLNVFKLIAAITMIIIAFKSTRKQFIFNFILLFIFTYSLGGAITSLSGTSYLTNFGVIISSKISLEFVTICIIVLTYIFELVVKHIKFKVKTNNLIYPITLYKNGNKLKINAYLDTGNLLTVNDSPIIVLDIKSYLKLTNKSLIDFYITPGEYISTNTVSGNNKLKIEKLDKLEIKINGKNKIVENQLVAISNNFNKTNYKALLSPAFM